MSFWRNRVAAAAAGISLLMAVAAPEARALGVHAALLPDSLHVAPFSYFQLEIAVTEAGSLFNGYDAVISYDPEALTFIPESPVTLQEGTYMTEACGQTFQRFRSEADSLIVSHSLLCNELTLAGPGQLYKLRFRAGQTPRTTMVHLRRVRFYDAGLFVDPTLATDATVIIEAVSGVAPGAGADPGLALGPPAPNPCVTGTEIGFSIGRETTIQLGIWDVQGRQVARLASGSHRPGSHHIVWNGAGDAGRLPQGLYFVRLKTADACLTRRLVVSR